MKANVLSLDSVLRERQQWVVPVYQRHYEWETGDDKQLPKLWEDLRQEALAKLDKRTSFPHYFGAIIYSEPQNQPYGVVPSRFLIDGQQRITTFHLVLAAIKEVGHKNHIERLVSVIKAYLFNEVTASMEEPAREQFKLWPSSYDRLLFQHIIENSRETLRVLHPDHFDKNKPSKRRSPNILRAYWFLVEALEDFVRERTTENGDEVGAVLEGVLAGFLSGFQLVIIHLDQHDDAQEIFASLNGFGKPLSPFDLIRNDVFHRARKNKENEDQLFDCRWKLLEEPFWTEEVRQGRSKRARADHLVAHAVVAETAREVNVGKIAAEYQRYSEERDYATIADELDVLLTHATTYKAMEDGNTQGPLARISSVLRIWDLSTFHPIIFRINAQLMGPTDREQLFKLLESYIVRREICGLTTKNYNKVITSMLRQFKELKGGPRPIAALKQQLFAELTGDASRMPRDVEIAEACARTKAYGRIPTRRLVYILRQIEHGMRSSIDEVTVMADNLTVEHIMPQKWAEHWPLPNGALAPAESIVQASKDGKELSDETKSQMEARQNLVDTLGNLTLLTDALNPSIGNGPWKEKKKKLAGSLLALNRAVAAREEWNEAAIQARAAVLASTANGLWPVG